MGVNHGLNRPPAQEKSLFEPKGKETGRNEGRLLDFLGITGWDHGAPQLPTRQGRKDPKDNSHPIRAASSVSKQDGVGENCLGFNRSDVCTQSCGGQSHGGRTPPEDLRLVVPLAFDSSPGELLWTWGQGGRRAGESQRSSVFERQEAHSVGLASGTSTPEGRAPS